MKNIDEYIFVFQVKGCVKVLKDQPASSSENLLNALRFVISILLEGFLFAIIICYESHGPEGMRPYNYS